MSPCLAVQMSLQSKIEVMQGKLIFGSHAEHTAAYHQTNSSRYRSVHKQEFIRINGNVIKTALMNTSTELNKIFQDTPTKQQDPKLKHSVVMIEFFFSNSRAHLSIFRTNCPDGSHYHPLPLFFTQPSHSPFLDIYITPVPLSVDMYIYKTPPTPTQNTHPAVRTAPFEALTAPRNLLQGEIKNQI